MVTKKSRTKHDSNESYERERREALVSAATSNAAMVEISRIFKRSYPQTSLRWLASRAKIPSSGYLSEVFQGRRLLSQKHAKGIAAALKFKEDEQLYFSKLLLRDHTVEEVQKAILDHELAAANKRLGVKDNQLYDDVQDLFFAIEVFSAMSMFGETVAPEQLESFYEKRRPETVHRAIKVLVDFGMIEATSTDRLRTIRPLAHFTAKLDGSFYEQFMRSVLFDSLQKLQSWFQKRDSAVFSTSVVSVDMNQYREMVPKIKRQMLDWISELERSSDADGVVRINLQMFPISEIS